MTRLSSADLEAILALLESAHDAASEAPFPPQVLEGLASLVPCDEVTFSELDRVQKEVIAASVYRRDGPHDGGASMATLWRLVDQHPLCGRAAAGGCNAMKVSDFITRRELRRREIYREWFVPWDTEHDLELALPSPLFHTKTFVFTRSGAWADFDERDRSVLNVLRPHLVQVYRNAKLRRRLAADCREDAAAAVLTPREREILALVRQGKTNAEVGRELWISPGTVRKHLENVYDKLGVRSRTAALARLSGS